MDSINGLALARIGIGVTAYAAPDFFLKGAMLDPSAPQAPYLSRMFAAREIALGLVTLLAPPSAKASVISLGIAVDAADAGAGLMALQNKSVSTTTGAVLTGAALAAVAAGVGGLLQRRSLTA